MENIFAPIMGELKELLPGRIREVRKAAKLTQADLAKKVGTGRSSIILWESETEESNITIGSIEKIAEACGVSVFDLVKPKG